MKKLYSLLLLALTTVSFGQVFYSENFGTPTGTTLFPAYTTGTAPATFQNSAPILYTGTGDVRITTVSSGYSGASGGGNVFLNAATENLQIDGLNTSAYTSANILLSFGYNAGGNVANLLTVEFSTDATNWTAITYTPTATAWSLVSIPGGTLPSSATLSLRFTQPAATQIRLDDITLTNFNPACSLVLGTPVTLCDAVTYGIDTYTTTIPFTGGGVGPYTITPTVGTVSGDNPDSVATGNIIINGVNEGTPVSVTITKGVCTFSANAVAPDCKPINSLPYSEAFPYTADTSLGTSQKWGNANSGDTINLTAGSLTYPGFTTAGNSVIYAADGAECFTSLTSTATGTIYYSYLLNVSSMTAVTDVNGGYISGFSKATTNLGATLWTKRVDDTNFNLGIEVRTANGANTTYTSAIYATGTTYFVVVGYTFGAATTDDDTVSLWIDPVLNGTQPAATLTDAQLTGATDLTDIDNFFLRQDSTTETPSVQIDELRVGITWADVSTSVLSVNQNSIAGLKIYPNPVSNGKLYITSDSGADKTVAIFDILGKQVMATALSNDVVNVSALNAGVYIVKVTEAGNTATRKLVIR